MATTLKYDKFIAKNVIVNDNIKNKKNIEMKKITFNSKVIWIKPIKLTIELTKYISSVTLKRTNTETEDPSVEIGFIKTINNPSNTLITEIDDTNFYFGDTIEIKNTNLSTTDKVIYRLYDSPIKLTGDTTISVKAKKGVFDSEIVSAIRHSGRTLLKFKNPNSVKCGIDIEIESRDTSGPIAGPTEYIELESGHESNFITLTDGFREDSVWVNITTRDLTYGYESTTKSSEIECEQ